MILPSRRIVFLNQKLGPNFLRHWRELMDLVQELGLEVVGPAIHIELKEGRPFRLGVQVIGAPVDFDSRLIFLDYEEQEFTVLKHDLHCEFDSLVGQLRPNANWLMTTPEAHYELIGQALYFP